MVHTFKGRVLELHTDEKKELDEKTGVEKVVATYHSLRGYEFGEKYPKVVEIKLKPNQVASARLLVDTTAEILLTEFKGTYNGKEYTNYNFVSGHTVQDKKAA